jgi:hypothetical protein
MESKLKLDEEETWKEDIAALTNEELVNQSHLYKVRYEMFKDEINKRVQKCLAEDPEMCTETAINLPPVAKRIVLLKIAGKDGTGL